MTAIPRRRRYVLWSVVGAMTVTGGVVGYALTTREEAPSCDRLMANDHTQGLLDSRYDSDESCVEFGTELRAALIGKEPGRHTAEQARAMRAVVMEIGADILERREARVHEDLRQPVAGALVDYAEDVYDVVNLHSQGDEDATHKVEDGVVRTALPREDLIRTLLAVADDPVAHGLLFGAMVGQCAQKLASIDRKTATRAALADDDPGETESTVSLCGSALGWLNHSSQHQMSRLGATSPEVQEWSQTMTDTLTGPATAAPPPKGTTAAQIADTWKHNRAGRPSGVDYTGHGADLITVWTSALGFDEEHEVTTTFRNKVNSGSANGHSFASSTTDCLKEGKSC